MYTMKYERVKLNITDNSSSSQIMVSTYKQPESSNSRGNARGHE